MMPRLLYGAAGCQKTTGAFTCVSGCGFLRITESLLPQGAVVVIQLNYEKVLLFFKQFSEATQQWLVFNRVVRRGAKPTINQLHK